MDSTQATKPLAAGKILTCGFCGSFDPIYSEESLRTGENLLEEIAHK